MTAQINLEKAKLPEYAQEFIGIFLRFEFALKETGYCQQDGNASVDWGRVTAALGNDFLPDLHAEGLVRTFLQSPPKKQVARNHSLGWEPQGPPQNAHELFLAVRRVRNNLLHGGKSGDPERDVDEPTRSETLIREAQHIILRALERLEDVGFAFEGRY